MSIQPGGEVLEDRRRLMAAVDTAMSLLVSGLTAQAAEVEGVDFKEEAGRRGRGGVILPGIPRNTAVGDQLRPTTSCIEAEQSPAAATPTSSPARHSPVDTRHRARTDSPNV